MRTCKVCKRDKPVTDFPFHNVKNRVSSRRTLCYSCFEAYELKRKNTTHRNLVVETEAIIEQQDNLILHIKSVIRLIEAGKWGTLNSNPMTNEITSTQNILLDYYNRLQDAEIEYMRLLTLENDIVV